MLFSLLFFFIISSCVCEEGFNPDAVPHSTIAKLKQIIASGDQETLVYFYTSFKECPECKELMPTFHNTVDYLNKLEDGKVVSYKIAVKFADYGINKLPQLVLFLGSQPFRYNIQESFEVDEILDWVEEAKQTPVQKLTDETFEHLTQASTGATTGDWLILFSDGRRPDCLKPYLPDIGSVAVKLRGRKNAAYVDVSESTEVHTRFSPYLKNKCASILFFHRTQLYIYESGDFSTNALVDFMLAGFTKQEGIDVPKPSSAQHEEMDEAIKQLRASLTEYASTHTTYFVIMLSFVLFLLYGFWFLFKQFQKRKIH